MLQLPQQVQDIPASPPAAQPHQAYIPNEGRSKSAGPLIPSPLPAALSPLVGAVLHQHHMPVCSSEADKTMDHRAVCHMQVPSKSQASKGGEGAAVPFPVNFNAPIPPPKPSKPSLAAFAQAVKARPQQGPGSRGI